MDLKYGEQAEETVAELSGKWLAGKQVSVCLFRNDNLLCMSNLSEGMDDFEWKTLLLPFGAIEKSFVMRDDEGAFETMHYSFILLSTVNLFIFTTIITIAMTTTTTQAKVWGTPL